MSEKSKYTYIYFYLFYHPRYSQKHFVNILAKKANHYTHPIPVGKKGNKALYDNNFKENYFLPILSKSAFTFVYILSTKKNSAKSHKIEKG